MTDEIGELAPRLAEERLAMLRDLGVRTGQNLLAEILTNYLNETPLKLERLRQALAGQDAQAVVFSAHSLKGISAQLGVERVAGIAARIETIGRSGSLEGCASLVEALEGEWELVRPLLEARR